jgi:hypothetical protein
LCRPRHAPLPDMPTSKGQGAKRAFVATLKALGAKYGVSVTVSRASSDADVRPLPHPDKGGTAAMKKKETLTKALYIARVKRVLKTKKAHAVAAACTKGLRKVCKEVLAKKGAATHG